MTDRHLRVEITHPATWLLIGCAGFQRRTKSPSGQYDHGAITQPSPGRRHGHADGTALVWLYEIINSLGSQEHIGSTTRAPRGFPEAADDLGSAVARPGPSAPGFTLVAPTSPIDPYPVRHGPPRRRGRGRTAYRDRTGSRLASGVRCSRVACASSPDRVRADTGPGVSGERAPGDADAAERTTYGMTTCMA